MIRTIAEVFAAWCLVWIVVIAATGTAYRHLNKED